MNATVRHPGKRHRAWKVPARQRGIALITAVLIVALATILAVNVGFKGYLDQRRSGTMFALDQGFEVALGAEAWAADILQKDSQSGSKTDDFTEAWATPLPPIPIDGGDVAGQLEDMQGRFNLNSLVKYNNGVLEMDQDAVTRFENLLDILGLEKKWAKILVDWIDTDVNPGFPDGAEDNVYTTLTPPYRPPNMLITRSSELLALAGFGLERYQKLEPFVTALPMGTPINLCTASPDVLDALIQGQRQFTLARDNVLETRKQRCFPTMNEFQQNLSAADKQSLTSGKVIAETSSYFRATTWVTIGTTRFTLYSLLYRANGLVRPYLRSFGSA
ncbi:MAG TPA: type II secretion system minor pseudopilin GspK [Steroidobacteraceae bacterium]|jgi:general secretion pathway protein K